MPILPTEIHRPQLIFLDKDTYAQPVIVYSWEVPASQWERLVEQYAQIGVYSTISTRIFTYYKILLIWWLVRITRYLYEIPRGFDQRLSPSSRSYIFFLGNLHVFTDQ